MVADLRPHLYAESVMLNQCSMTLQTEFFFNRNFRFSQINNLLFVSHGDGTFLK